MLFSSAGLATSTIMCIHLWPFNITRRTLITISYRVLTARLGPRERQQSNYCISVACALFVRVLSWDVYDFYSNSNDTFVCVQYNRNDRHARTSRSDIILLFREKKTVSPTAAPRTYIRTNIDFERPIKISNATRLLVLTIRLSSYRSAVGTLSNSKTLIYPFTLYDVCKLVRELCVLPHWAVLQFYCKTPETFKHISRSYMRYNGTRVLSSLFLKCYF